MVQYWAELQPGHLLCTESCMQATVQGLNNTFSEVQSVSVCGEQIDQSHAHVLLLLSGRDVRIDAWQHNGTASIGSFLEHVELAGTCFWRIRDECWYAPDVLQLSLKVRAQQMKRRTPRTAMDADALGVDRCWAQLRVNHDLLRLVLANGLYTKETEGVASMLRDSLAQNDWVANVLKAL